MRATARACANIAFVKYWGKRDPALNLPAAGSLSLTLDGLHTTTTVSFGGAAEDTLVVDGAELPPRALRKAQVVLDLVRRQAGLELPALVESQNSFPTGAGLASSASGLAALALASSAAAGLRLPPEALSVLARRGSGSACRSVFGGFVEWRAGVRADGSDSHAVPLCPPEHWDLRALVVVLSEEPKAVGSTRGMLATAQSSPFQPAFVASVDGDLAEARRAVAERDLGALTRVAERSCLRMHGAMMAADPPLIYLRPESWAVIRAVRELRGAGLPVFFTADAGPNVKVFHPPEVGRELRQTLGALPGVSRLIEARPGPGASLVEP